MKKNFIDEFERLCGLSGYAIARIIGISDSNYHNFRKRGRPANKHLDDFVTIAKSKKIKRATVLELFYQSLID